MTAVVEERDKPFRTIGETVDMGAWVAANQPRLHPTRRKVLTVVADLTQNGRGTTSSKVRAHTGLSQQLLNRHLRALQEKELVELQNPGPGLPLNTMVTNAGLRALGMRGPKAENASDTRDRHTMPLEREAAPEPGQTKNLSEQLPPDLGLKDDFLSALSEMIYKSVQAKLSGLAGGEEPSPAALQMAEPPPKPEAEAKVRQASPSHRGNPAPAKPAPRPSNDAISGPEVPPELNAAEAALENKLSSTAHHEVVDLPWYQRTKQFQNVWDQLRRRHLGQLTTYFNSFGPRWKRLDWADFNLGRRQADSRGANYLDWIMAQFDRILATGTQNIRPSDLHGQEAVQAYLDSQGITQETKKVSMGPPPYTPETFDLKNPDHVAYADRVLQDMAELGISVYGNAKDGPIRLVTQAVASGNFPKAALDLRPDWKEKVLSSLRLGHKTTPETAIATNLGLII